MFEGLHEHIRLAQYKDEEETGYAHKIKQLTA